MISKYFDDDWRSSDCKEMCDHCKGVSKTVQTYNIISCLTDLLRVIDVAYKKEVNLTLKKLLDAWFQTGPKNLQLSSSKPRFTKEQAEHIVAFLLAKNFLIVRRGYTLVSTLPYIDTNNDGSFNKNHGGKIIMQYCGTLKGIPAFSDNEIDNKGSTKGVFQKTEGNEKYEKDSGGDDEKILPSSSRIDLTNEDSDDDTVSSEDTVRQEKAPSKRSRRISSTSTEDSKASSNSLNDFVSANKRVRKS